MLEFKRYQDIASFEKDTFPYLQKYEIVNGLLLGLLQSKVNQNPVLMATIKREERILLVLLQTHSDKNIILSNSEYLTAKEKEEISLKLVEVLEEEVFGFIGGKGFVLQIGEAFTLKNGTKFAIHMNQRIYKLAEVTKRPNDIGKIRRAEQSDFSIVSEWFYQFSMDTNLPMLIEDAKKSAEAAIDNQRLYVWEVDNKLVSMANATRPTRKNITINYVFTPKVERKKGYASNVVSALSQLMLDSGYKTTSLYTDLDNPTSNKIYMEIGYKAIADSIVIRADK